MREFSGRSKISQHPISLLAISEQMDSKSSSRSFPRERDTSDNLCRHRSVEFDEGGIPHAGKSRVDGLRMRVNSLPVTARLSCAGRKLDEPPAYRALRDACHDVGRGEDIAPSGQKSPGGCIAEWCVDPGDRSR